MTDETKEIIYKTHSITQEYDVKWHEKLGTGVSGPVRPCVQKTTGKSFALKCLHDRSRSRREVALHFKCSGHPHIVSIYDVFRNEVHFPGETHPRAMILVVMELMSGGELFDRISKNKYFTEQQASKYTKQICLAIQRCHSLNVAHRDIKPENLLLKDNSENALIKLSDFGFAKEDEGNLMTPHYTPYYVAPQILEAQKKQEESRYIYTDAPYAYDKSCDMWSLGVIIYIMLCGYPPFYSETPSKQITTQMKGKIMAGQYTFPEEDWGHISSMARDLVSKLLTVNPSDRIDVGQVLSHPWLLGAPLVQLNSPAVILDKDNFLEVQAAHAAQLTAMRLPDKHVRLKPMPQLNNPIIRKRLRPSPLNTEDSCKPPPPKSPARDLGLQSIRDVIARCIMPPLGMTEAESQRLVGLLLQKAIKFYPELPALQTVLHNFPWDGEKFTTKFDMNKLAHSLGQVVEKLELSRQQEPANNPAPSSESIGELQHTVNAKQADNTLMENSSKQADNTLMENSHTHASTSSKALASTS